MQSPISLAEAQVTHLHGSFLRVLRVLVGATVPEADRAAFVEALPAVSHGLLDPGVELEAWVSLPGLMEILRALEQRLAHSPRAVLGALLSELVAEERLFREAKDAQDPLAAVRRIPEAFALFSQGGRLTVAEAAPGRAILWVWAVDDYPDIRRELVAGFAVEVLRATGAAEPRVEIDPAPPGEFGDRFRISWG